MARHTIQIPINKSSTKSLTTYPYYWTYFKYKAARDSSYFDVISATQFTLAPINPVGDKLFCASLMYSSDEMYNVVTYDPYGRAVSRFGIGWDPEELPQNKNYVSAKIYFYSIKGTTRAIYYTKYEFFEGGALPKLDAEGVSIGGIPAGWGSIDISPTFLSDNKHNSLIIRTVEGISGGQYDSDANFIYYEYTGDYWELYSHRDLTYAPYIELVYDDLPPEQPTGLAPSAETLNPRAVIRFSWKHNSPEGAVQKAFELQWSSDGGSTWNTVTQTSTNEYYDMPAATLPTSGTITWRVRTTDINDEVSEYNTTAFTAGVVPQKAPLAVAPIGTYKDKATVIRFEWVFLGGATGETQSKFDLDYSINNGSTWTTITQTTANKYYDLAANTLDIGSVVWRVRTYNEYDEVSPYSTEKYFAVIGTPGAPSIGTISNNSRPLISWASSDQVLIDFEITQSDEVIYSTGIIASIEKSHQVTEYLEDGTYTVRIRIANAFEMWSSWAEKSFTLNPTRPTKPVVSIEAESYALLLSVGNLSTINLILRDGVVIGEVSQGLFRDYTAGNGTSYSYVARVIDADGNHSDSDPVAGILTFKGNTIATASSPGEYLVIKNGFSSPIEKVESMDSVIALTPFDGRELPVAEYSGHRTRSKTVAAFVSKEELSTMKALIRQFKPLIFRDNNGDVMVGAVAGLQSRQNYFGYEVSFIINEIEV